MCTIGYSFYTHIGKMSRKGTQFAFRCCAMGRLRKEEDAGPSTSPSTSTASRSRRGPVSSGDASANANTNVGTSQQHGSERSSVMQQYTPRVQLVSSCLNEVAATLETQCRRLRRAQETLNKSVCTQGNEMMEKSAASPTIWIRKRRKQLSAN